MGSQRRPISLAVRVHERTEQLTLCLRHERHDVLRKLRRRWRLRLHVASLLRERLLGSLFERRLGLVWGRGLLLGFSLSLGMDSVPLRNVVLLPGRGLGLDARRLMDGAEQYHRRHKRTRTPSGLAYR